ncbi:hypothetical protein [Bifidobacterium choerinum]|uniref:Uncharacterized protein n=1 Tax=Bifidobacterium choerinum TaxID=35760 RepID=A0A2D3D6Z9_9BIFI|nr:hypothetical protein [Bifidobacterium choerinum]ATU20700.1 hypothetical protein BcFMB_06950 [Bifidobacterium choerinum]
MAIFDPSFPCAIADATPEGERTGAEWWLAHWQQLDEPLTVWTHTKKGADANPFISQLISHEQVNHVTSQPHIFSAYGPVLAMYPTVIDLGNIMRATGTTALCVIRGDDLTLWSKEVNAEVLLQADAHATPIVLADDVREMLHFVSEIMNLNNSIGGNGTDKSILIREMLQLHDTGVTFDPIAMAEWAAAHGWSSKNIKHLMKYAEDINSGRKPQHRY